MPKANAEDFPAHGNHHGQTAGVKIDFAYDLLSGSVISDSLAAATTQDKVIGKETIARLRPGSLVLRDMGSSIISEYDEIERQDALWLSRLPLTTRGRFWERQGLRNASLVPEP